jgi:hypothetical protein
VGIIPNASKRKPTDITDMSDSTDITDMSDFKNSSRVELKGNEV